MNLGSNTVSSTYQYILNQNGPNIQLGNGNEVNWDGAKVMMTTGNQTVAGIKTFTDYIVTPNLYINNSITDASLEIGGAGNVYIDLKKPNSNDYDVRIATDGSAGTFTTATGPLALQTNGNYNRLYITQAGNIGINTSSPSSTLHVNGHTISNTYCSFSSTSTHTQQGAYLEWNKDASNGKTYLLNQKGGGGGGIVFGEIDTANTISTNMQITAAGQVAFNYHPETSSAGLDIRLDKYPVKKLTLAGAHTFTTTQGIAGSKATLIIVGHSATSYTPVWGANFKFAAVIPAIGANKYFVVEFVSDGSTWIETSRTAVY